MYAHLSAAEVNAVFAALAKKRQLDFPGTLHDTRQGFIIENFTRRETARFLTDLKRRQQLGLPLVPRDRE
jgi:hypothetical protein